MKGVEFKGSDSLARVGFVALLPQLLLLLKFGDAHESEESRPQRLNGKNVKSVQSMWSPFGTLTNRDPKETKFLTRRPCIPQSRRLPLGLTCY